MFSIDTSNAQPTCAALALEIGLPLLAPAALTAAPPNLGNPTPPACCRQILPVTGPGRSMAQAQVVSSEGPGTVSTTDIVVSRRPFITTTLCAPLTYCYRAAAGGTLWVGLVFGWCVGVGWAVPPQTRLLGLLAAKILYVVS
jgi:hypothetical protein